MFFIGLQIEDKNHLETIQPTGQTRLETVTEFLNMDEKQNCIYQTSQMKMEYVLQFNFCCFLSVTFGHYNSW